MDGVGVRYGVWAGVDGRRSGVWSGDRGGEAGWIQVG